MSHPSVFFSGISPVDTKVDPDLVVSPLPTVCHIPVETPRPASTDTRPSPAWLRPVQRRASSSPAGRKPRPSGQSNGSFQGRDDPRRYSAGGGRYRLANQAQDLNSLFTDGLDNPASANALLSTQDFFDMAAAASPASTVGGVGVPQSGKHFVPGREDLGAIFETLGPASAPYDQFESLEPDTVMADVPGDAPPQATWDVPFAPGNDVLGNM